MAGARSSHPGPQWVRIGRVGKAHGSGGGFYLDVPAFPGAVTAGMKLLVGGRELEVADVGGMPTRPLVHTGAVASREEAAQLKGGDVWALRDALPVAEPGEWYGSDLEGMAVTDGTHALGSVRRLVNLPSVDVLEVELAEGGEELLVPLVEDAVVAVDLDARVVTVDRRFLGLDAEV